jgi:RNA polymerase sigma-70 factor (ECF subfamily)
MSPQAKTLCELGDADLARLLARRDPAAVRIVTARNNQRLFRAALSILKDRHEAEDAVQTAYLKAFAAIDGFEGRSSLSTWLTRIAVNEALMRCRAARSRRARLNDASVGILEDYREKSMVGSMSGAPPDAEFVRGQIRGLLEQAIEQLPSAFRPVFVLREIEGLSIDETAEALGIIPATVKTRLYRAKRQLQRLLAPEVKTALEGTFPFAGADCARLTERLIAAYCAANCDRYPSDGMTV